MVLIQGVKVHLPLSSAINRSSAVSTGVKYRWFASLLGFFSAIDF